MTAATTAPSHGRFFGNQHTGPSITDDTPDGLTRNQRYQFRQMADHEDIMEQVIAESDDEHPPSRRKVLAAIAAKTRPNATTPAERGSVVRLVTPEQVAAEILERNGIEFLMSVGHAIGDALRDALDDEP